MRAVAVRAFRAPAELLELEPRPPGPGEVEVRTEAAGMNPFDWKIADGTFEGRRPHLFPLVLGVDAAGVVDELGEGSSRFRRGDRIFGSFLHHLVGTGTYVERARAPETNALVPVPPELSPAQAAALPTAGMAALQAIDRLSLGPEAPVLVVGAAGGVGSFAVQLAASKGAHVVGVARRSAQERLHRLGVRAVVDPGATDPHSAAAASAPGGFVGLVDLASDRPAFSRWASLVRAGGVAVSTVGAAGEQSPDERGVLRVSLNMQPRAIDLERLAEEVRRGRLNVPLERTLRLGEAPAAVAESRAGHGSGKAVIVF